MSSQPTNCSLYLPQQNTARENICQNVSCIENSGKSTCILLTAGTILTIYIPKSRGNLYKLFTMEKLVRKTMTLPQTLKTLRQQASEEWLEWTEEVNADFSSEVEFLLWMRWRWLLCHIWKSHPYIIRYRLIGERNYERVKPEKFIAIAKTKLYH